MTLDATRSFTSCESRDQSLKQASVSCLGLWGCLGRSHDHGFTASPHSLWEAGGLYFPGCWTLVTSSLVIVSLQCWLSPDWSGLKKNKFPQSAQSETETRPGGGASASQMRPLKSGLETRTTVQVLLPVSPGGPPTATSNTLNWSTEKLQRLCGGFNEVETD